MEKLFRSLDNISIFKDTQKHCKSEPYLIEAVKKADLMQEFISEVKELEEIENCKVYENTKIVVSKKRTLEAARDYKGKKVGVLNFADAITPGGAVLYGASTQEEAICRCSTLYENISKAEMLEVFYKPHELLNVLYNNDIIYTPDVVVFKEDTSEANMLPKEEWYPVDVITCAAPNLGVITREKRKQINVFELMMLHRTRIERILEVAKKKGCEVLILGAFGCGAFANPPEIVAKVFKEALEIYGKYFETVEFAVYCAEEEIRNYKIFKEVLEDF